MHFCHDYFYIKWFTFPMPCFHFYLPLFSYNYFLLLFFHFQISWFVLSPYFRFHLPLFCCVILSASTLPVLPKPVCFVDVWGIWLHLYLRLISYIIPIIPSFLFHLIRFSLYISYIHVPFFTDISSSNTNSICLLYEFR